MRVRGAPPEQPEAPKPEPAKGVQLDWGITLTVEEARQMAHFGEHSWAPIFARILKARVDYAVRVTLDRGASLEDIRYEQGAAQVLDDLKVILSEDIPEKLRAIVAAEPKEAADDRQDVPRSPGDPAEGPGDDEGLG